ncbi:alpha/beta hydrolase [Curtobacterium sp. MCJR17_043]|uniref:alpha/beta hydrolase n=1 Tax=Curtobacterium sp. MCJR17_043 TaxID=2175660 RepID=UPI0024DF4E7C|nr:alpha/beta hydrolase [Curtobacterium sp. MCJR17_043]WIB35932.1 alpha/beta hydrolase [Curtobacterium sp. MCJR17_043]
MRACQLAEDRDVAGLLLLGSYCADDRSDSDLDVLSVSGSRDGLSTPEDVAAVRDLLPASATMTEVAGADHAAFGAYGAQPGDLPRDGLPPRVRPCDHRRRRELGPRPPLTGGCAT